MKGIGVKEGMRPEQDRRVNRKLWKLEEKGGCGGRGPQRLAVTLGGKG